MSAWFKSKAAAAPPQPEPFSGVGVYLTSEVHSARATNGYLLPQKLIESLASILGYQLSIIEAHGGIVEQFVGDCVVAYWKPADAPKILTSVSDAATKILREKVSIPEIEFCLRINFSLADMAGAFFGPESGRRFQIIGRARDRCDALPKFSPRTDCIFTDAETVAAMSDSNRSRFSPVGPRVFSLRASA